MKKNTANRKSVRDPLLSGIKGKPATKKYDWTRVFALTEHWKSDLMFFGDEMRFLKSLIDRYFIALTEKKNIDKTRAMAVSLTDLENKRTQLQKKMDGHLMHLGESIKDSFSHDSEVTLLEHEGIETEMTDFVKQFRVVKIELFKLTEHVLESEKARHLLGK